jgi:hypothetical protein
MLLHGAREKGGTVLIVHVRLQAILASLVMLPSLFRRGLLWSSWFSNGNITCCSGVSTTVEALRQQAPFHCVFLGESGLLTGGAVCGARRRRQELPSPAAGLSVADGLPTNVGVSCGAEK